MKERDPNGAYMRSGQSELRRAGRATGGAGAPHLEVRAKETVLIDLPKPGRSMLRYALVVPLLSACSSSYYNAMEHLGFPKRELLVDRVEEARESNEQAAEQFKDALEKFIAVTGVKGGALQEKYGQLESEYEQSEARATEVHRRVAGVEDVAEALFDEWEAELDQYTSAPLRRSSERRLQQTRAQYRQLIRAMKRAEAKMDPVLAAFHDQVLISQAQPQRPSDRLTQGQPGFDRVGHRGAYPGDGGVDSRGESLHRCDEHGAGLMNVAMLV